MSTLHPSALPYDEAAPSGGIVASEGYSSSKLSAARLGTYCA